MMLRLRRTLCVMVGALWLLSAMPEPAFAQDPPSGASKRKKSEKREKRRKKARDKRKKAEEAATATPEPAAETKTGKPEAEPKRDDQGTSPKGNTASRDAARAAQDAAQGVDSQIVKEGDTSVKVMEFSGLDIEGRLKSPQLLYFVNRVRAEFDRPKLPHRSFMPELESSTKKEPLE
jgi:hypothetical protein